MIDETLDSKCTVGGVSAPSLPVHPPSVDPVAAASLPSPIRPSSAPLEVRDAGSGKGRGVFALSPVPAHTVLEVCLCL